MFWRLEVTRRGRDPQSGALSQDLSSVGLRNLPKLRLVRLYFLAGDLSQEQVEELASQVFSDPVSDTYRVTTNEVAVCDLEILYNHGVMDPSVAGIQRAIADCVNRTGQQGCRESKPPSGVQVRTGRGYYFGRKLSAAEFSLAQRVLFNPLIEHACQPGEQVFAEPAEFRFTQRVVELRGKSAEELNRISREGLLALSLEEMLELQRYYEGQDRDPTEVELETFAQTWSEHCQHKTFRGEIDFNGHELRNLLKSTIFRVTEELAPDWCLSTFNDNSGVIAFDDKYGVTFKVETHNHPSALEPYGGAATGVGGVIRDCLGTGCGAKPILLTDVFCFAPVTTPVESVPQGVIHPRQIMRGVVAGVRDYGNRMGIPTASGAVYFHEGFIGNPLVFCGAVGLIPRRLVRKRVCKGQAIVLVGGRTGRDGVHGVTFASLELGQDSQEFSSGAVQIGNPIEEKKVADLILAARDEGLVEAITDCGGGGLSSAIGELTASLGCEVELDRVPLKYAGLSPAEIWISEAQERMVILTSQRKVNRLLELARALDVEATVMGHVTKTGRLVLNFRGSRVADIDMKFLHSGWRGTKRVARWSKPETADPFVRTDQDLTDVLVRLLQAPNITSKEWVVRQYDHEVQAQTVVKPFCGPDRAGPTDGCVVTPVKGSYRACVIGCGLAPRYGLIDPYWMAASAIDEALRNCVALGADVRRIALLDNFCWGSPERPDQLAGLVRAAQACYDIAKGYRVPFISGKDSLYNEFRTKSGNSIPVPPTLLVSALGIVSDARRTVTADFKQAGSCVYVVGETREELGGSEYFRMHQGLGREVPKVEPRSGRRIMTALGRAIRSGLVNACHDIAEGGLGVCLAEMGFAGRVGARVRLRRVPGAGCFRRDDFLLFSESNTRFVCEVRPEARRSFEALLGNVPCSPVGQTTSEPVLSIVGLDGAEVVRLDLDWAMSVWRRSLSKHLQ
ncbi:MAG: phosphoribosylformylglycinamidine synthase subunit PurL [candidate division WOR-3 bacterium]